MSLTLSHAKHPPRKYFFKVSINFVLDNIVASETTTQASISLKRIFN
jgi:hypothetical protein